MGQRLAARLATVGAVLALLGTGAACGDSSTNPSGQSGGSKAITVKAGEFTWTAAKVNTAIVTEIARQRPDLDVSQVQATQLDPAPGWAGLQLGDLDMLMDVALPNQQPLADKARGSASLIDEIYGNGVQSWFVPSYVVQPGGAAAGLRSISQLNQYKNVFDGKLYDGDPGWPSTQINSKRLAGYGVDYQHVTSSEAAMLAQLKRQYDAKQPILVYLYRPHWVFTQFQMTQLEEPTPYSPDCFTTGNGACAMPAFTDNVAARDDLKNRAPKFYAMLTHVKIPIDQIEQMMAKVDIEKQDVATVAKQWVDQHSTEIRSW